MTTRDSATRMSMAIKLTCYVTSIASATAVLSLNNVSANVYSSGMCFIFSVYVIFFRETALIVKGVQQPGAEGRLSFLVLCVTVASF